MANIKIKKLYRSCVMDIIVDGKSVNAEVKPDDVVEVTPETISNLQHLKESYQVIDDKNEAVGTANKNRIDNKPAGSDDKDKK